MIYERPPLQGADGSDQFDVAAAHSTDEKQDVENAEAESKSDQTPLDADVTQKNIEDETEKYRGNRRNVWNTFMPNIRDPADSEKQQQDDVLYWQFYLKKLEK